MRTNQQILKAIALTLQEINHIHSDPWGDMSPEDSIALAGLVGYATGLAWAASIPTPFPLPTHNQISYPQPISPLPSDPTQP